MKILRVHGTQAFQPLLMFTIYVLQVLSQDMVAYELDQGRVKM